MLFASNLASKAINTITTTAPHAISHKLLFMGFLMGMLLPYAFLEFGDE